MLKILIIGAGAMGSAFSVPCVERKHQTTILGTHLEDDFIDNLNNNNKLHPVLNIILSNKISIVKSVNIKKEFQKKPDLIVVGVNSKGINWIAEQIHQCSNNSTLCPILLLTKGLSIYKNQYEILSHKLERLLRNKGLTNINISAVGGPCLAKDLAQKIHTSVVFASKDIEIANWLKKNLFTKYYHPSTSVDIIGVEVCAAIKNIFSMAIGVAKGMYYKNKTSENLYFNTSAALFKQSLFEMEIVNDFLSGKKETVNDLAGLGDLYVSSLGGRNSRMGTLLGQGYIYSKAKKLKMPKETIEGAELAFEIGKKIKKDFDIKKTPLLISMVNCLLEDKKFLINWNNFK